jgi:hypothetical protein
MKQFDPLHARNGSHYHLRRKQRKSNRIRANKQIQYYCLALRLQLNCRHTQIKRIIPPASIRTLKDCLIGNNINLHT